MIAAGSIGERASASRTLERGVITSSLAKESSHVKLVHYGGGRVTCTFVWRKKIIGKGQKKIERLQKKNSVIATHR